MVGLMSLLGVSFSWSQTYKTWHQLSEAEKKAYMERKGREKILEETKGQEAKTTLQAMQGRFETIANTRAGGDSQKLICLTFTSKEYKATRGKPFLGKAFFNPRNGHLISVEMGNGLKIGYKTYGSLRIPVGNDTENGQVNYTAQLRDLADSPYKTLVEQSLEAIRIFGPDYLQSDCRYNVSLNPYRFDGEYNSVSLLNGKPYYAVMFLCDMDKHKLKMPFTAHVAIWKDSGKIWKITFGNGESISFVNRPYEEVRHDKDHRIVPWEEWAFR